MLFNLMTIGLTFLVPCALFFAGLVETLSRSWNLPYFECAAKLSDRTEISGSYQVTTAVQSKLQTIQAVIGHHWDMDFFGFHLPSVQSLLDNVSSEQAKKRSHATRKVNRLS